MYRTLRALLLATAVAAPLAGCQTSASSTYGTDNSVTGSLGVDSHGSLIDGNFRGIPNSNQVSLKGDQSARLLEQGKEAFGDSNYGLSEKYFRQAVEVRPDNANAWMGLAASYDQLGRFDLADRAYEQLSKLKGRDARVLNNRGYSYLLRGDYKLAAKVLNEAQAADPSLEEVQGNLHLLEKVRDS